MEKREAPKPVGLWIRVSTEDQAKGESPEHHEKRARFYAEAKGWKVREVYRLEAVSGKAVKAHPEAQRMLKDVRRGHITGIIFSKLARLARNTKELLEIADLFRECTADLISLDESIDTSTPAGRFFYTMIAGMAQWEREEIAGRVAASVPIRAKLGKPLGGAAPYGYRWKDRMLTPDPKEAPIRKLMYELFLEHRRKKAVARLLNDSGHRTRNGSKFTDTTVDRLLRDPSAKGQQRANYTKSTGDKKRWVLKPREEWVIRPIEAVVSTEIWDQCNAILDERRNSRKRPGKRPVQLFAGVTRCICGGPMYVPSNTPKYVCYRCRNKIPVADLNTLFHEQLKAFFSSPIELARYIERADEVIREKEELMGTLRGERDRIAREMEKLLQLYLNDRISADGFGRNNRPLEERRVQIEQQIPELQSEIDFLRIQHLSRDQILTEGQGLYARWPTLLFEEKRKIVEQLVEQIILDKDEVTITLSYVPSSSEMMAQWQRNVIPALPFCRVVLKAKKPLSPAYPPTLITVGDHIRKRRLDLGLWQEHVADQLGGSATTIYLWEKHRNNPKLTPHLLEKIVAFLGYEPPR